MDLSIITVTHQSKAYIDACILSVVTSTLDCSYEHIIVDNASTDGTVELIESGYLNYVKLIKNSTNLGFAAANNQALKQARGRYVLFLNPDMQIHKGFLDTLIAWADTKPQMGLAGCKLLDEFKDPHPVLRPSKFPSALPYLPAFLGLRPFFCSVHPRFWYPSFNDDAEQEVEMVRGAFMLVRREVLDKLGFGFDPRYFILFEDIDLCREVRRLGYQVLYTPIVSCIDYLGRSFVKQTKAWKYLHVARSLQIYFRKWHSPAHRLWLPVVSVLGFLLRIPRWGVRTSVSALKNFLTQSRLQKSTAAENR